MYNCQALCTVCLACSRLIPAPLPSVIGYIKLTDSREPKALISCAVMFTNAPSFQPMIAIQGCYRHCACCFIDSCAQLALYAKQYTSMEEWEEYLCIPVLYLPCF